MYKYCSQITILNWNRNDLGEDEDLEPMQQQG